MSKRRKSSRPKQRASAARRSSSRPRALRGLRGAPGPPGPRGESGSGVPFEIVEQLEIELKETQRSLEVQFTRIAQLQSELDSLRASLKWLQPPS
jgi:hypothetical protein